MDGILKLRQEGRETIARENSERVTSRPMSNNYY